MTLDDITAHHHGAERYELAAQVAAEVARRILAEAEFDARPRHCPTCDTAKTNADFGTDSRGTDGRFWQCRACRNPSQT